MHVVLDVVDVEQQTGAVARADLVHGIVELFNQLAVLARDDDQLQLGVVEREVFIDLQHARYAEGACHQQHGRFIRVESFAAADLFLCAGKAEFFKGGDAQGINQRLIHAVFLDQLVCHLRLGDDVGVDIGHDVGAVRVKVGDERDRLDVFKLALRLELGDHRRDKGVAHDDDVGLMALDLLHQLARLGGVELHDRLVGEIFAVGDLVHAAVYLGRLLDEEIIAFHGCVVIHFADRAQTVDHGHLNIGIQAFDRVLQRCGGSFVPAARRGGKNQNFHMTQLLAAGYRNTIIAIILSLKDDFNRYFSILA